MYSYMIVFHAWLGFIFNFLAPNDILISCILDVARRSSYPVLTLFSGNFSYIFLILLTIAVDPDSLNPNPDTDLDPGFWWPKIEGEKKYFFDQKLHFTYVQATGEAFSP